MDMASQIGVRKPFTVESAVEFGYMRFAPSKVLCLMICLTTPEGIAAMSCGPQKRPVGYGAGLSGVNILGQITQPPQSNPRFW